MLFRYDFGEKLDLTKFRKQAPYYIGNMRELTYHLILLNYKIYVEIVEQDDSTEHLINLWFADLKRDKDNQIIDEHVIIPLIDTRFKESKQIQDLYLSVIDNYKAYFISSSATKTTEKLCQLIKLVSKLDHLKCFI